MLDLKTQLGGKKGAAGQWERPHFSDEFHLLDALPVLQIWDKLPSDFLYASRIIHEHRERNIHAVADPACRRARSPGSLRGGRRPECTSANRNAGTEVLVQKAGGKLVGNH